MRAVVIGTAGHIDHGKSALVRALTGTDPDRLKEEQARGITIDLGFAHTRAGDVQLAFVDVPGHERFVRNMLAGVGGIDAVMLVVAANESVKPQTREHFDICRLLGIGHGLVALTKSDLADDAMLTRAETEVRELLAGSLLEAAPILRVSVVTGDGLDALRTSLAALAGQPPRLERAGVIRLPVDRVFAARGFGTVVTGTLVSGSIAVGDTVTVLPSGLTSRVRGLQVHGAAATDVAGPQRVAVNLSGIETASIHRGATLATAGSLAVTRMADARLHLLASARPLAHGARVRVHTGTDECLARVSIAAIRETAAAAWRFAGAGEEGVAIPPGGDGFVRLRFERRVVITRGDRLVLRLPSPPATIGGAVVLDPEPPGAGVRRGSARARFSRLDSPDAAAALRVFLEEAGAAGVDADTPVRRAGLDPERARQVVDSLAAQGEALTLGGRGFVAVALVETRARLERDVARFHKTHPHEPGVPRETLRGQLGGRVADALFDAALTDLVTRGVVQGGERISLAAHQPAVSPAEARLRATVEARLRDGGLTPPDAAALAQATGASTAEVTRVLQALVRDKTAIRMGDFVFHADPLQGLKAAVADLRQGHAAGARVTLDIAAFKTRHGLTRKHAIPLLEWLDRERVTRRIGDARIVVG